MKRLLILTAFFGFASAQTVRFALDWVPNTNHTGIYVALANGWYEEAGVELQILPYGGVSPEALVANGRAEVGVSSTESVLGAAAAGEPVVSVAAMLSTNTAALAVLEESGVTRPRELDGKVYAAFGAPWEAPAVAAVLDGAENSGLLVLGRRHHLLPLGSHLGPVARAAIDHAACPVYITPEAAGETKSNGVASLSAATS